MTKQFPKPKIKSSTPKTFRKKKTFNIDELITKLKEKDFSYILAELVQLVERPVLADVLLLKLNNSKYKAYSAALKQLNYVINDFKKSKDETILVAYLQNLNRETIKSDEYYYNFTTIRDFIINLYLQKQQMDGNLLYIVGNIHLISDETSPEYEPALVDFIATLAEKVWPNEAKGLGVLYGKN